jgi:tetratricopeptide (TPR) repeat protein
MEINSITQTTTNKFFERSLIFFVDVDNILKHSKCTEDFSSLLMKFKSMTADIFSCHNFFSEFPQNTYFNNVLNIIKEKSELDLQSILNEIKKYTKEVYDSKYSREEILVSILLFLYLFLQEATYGPSFLYIKETEKVDFYKEIEKFNNSFFFSLEKSMEKLKDGLMEYLTSNGEVPYCNMKLLIFYVICFELFVKEEFFSEFEISKLWKARIIFLQNKMFKDPVGEIQINLFKTLDSFNLEKVLETEETLSTLGGELKEKLKANNNVIKGMLQLEKSYFNLRYYKYKIAEDLIEEAKVLFNLKINLTGKLGRKTKYQEFDTAVLVVESESSTLEKLNSLELTDNQVTPTSVLLAEENPILEVPRITDDTFLQESYTELSLYDQMYVTALINSLKVSLPDEDLLREVISTYTHKSLEKSYDWLVYSKLLLQKSLAEDKRTKTIERALLQIQSLCDQYNDRAPEPYQRLKYYFIIDYPFIWNLKKHYAEMFMAYGAVLTAFDIFQELSMWEECVQCLYVAGKKERALEFAENILKNKPDPGVYCVLGELQCKEEYFHKALEVSKNRYTRAYRCLGKFYFSYKNDLEGSLKYYEKALELNPLFPNIWFTVGCIYLRQSIWEKAINAFSRSVSIDDSNAEGWANLGIAFNQSNKLKEAMKCLEQGLKRQRTNWKICENLLIISMDCKDLGKVIYCINHLFSLDKYDRVKPSAFYSLTTLFLTDFPSLSQNRIEYYKGKIYEIFEKFSMKDGVCAEIWDLYAIFVESAEIEINKTVSEEDKSEIFRAIVEIRLKQLRNLMIADLWEKEEKVIEKITKVLDKVKGDIVKVKKEDYRNEISAFINNIQAKIDKFYKMKEFEKAK